MVESLAHRKTCLAEFPPSQYSEVKFHRRLLPFILSGSFNKYQSITGGNEINLSYPKIAGIAPNFDIRIIKENFLLNIITSNGLNFHHSPRDDIHKYILNKLI